MIWQYGNYTFNCNFKAPTVSNFRNWLKDYLKLENVNKYDTWLASGFTQGWNTLDVDIVLTNKPKYKELQSLMFNAIKLGVKHNIFIDICHWDREPLDYSKTKEKIVVKKTVVGDRIIQDGKLITDWKHAKEVYPNLYSFTKVYPTDKQMNRIYKSKPILLN